MKRRVLITGTGAVTPLGVGARALHERWASGVCGIVDGAGACTEFEPGEYLTVKEIRRLDRFSQMALVAADEALGQAAWDPGSSYDPHRDGFVMGEGAGVLVLEEAQAAQARGATVLGEVAGYGATADAYHLTAPEPSGAPAARAIELALRDAELTPDEVDYVNAHG